jgi:uncharacterized membrane protein YeiH
MIVGAPYPARVILYILDMVGVFAFSAYGAHRARQAGMDYLGVFVCAALTALGGGTVRAVVLQQSPGFFTDYLYIAFVVLGAGFSILAGLSFDRLDPPLKVLDAIGLATFALAGAVKAAEAGWGLGPMILCALLTGAGGGVLCDLLTGRRPELFYGEFYAPPACLMGLLAWLARDHLANAGVCILLVAAVFAVRVLAILLRWYVRRPRPATAVHAGWQYDTVHLSRASLFPEALDHEQTLRLPRSTVLTSSSNRGQ